MARWSCIGSVLLTLALLAGPSSIVGQTDGHQKSGSSDGAHEHNDPDHDSHAAREHEGHGGHGDHDATVQHRFVDAEEWAERFEDPERDQWQLPDRVVSALIDRDDLIVADIGSATGYFPVRFAPAVSQGHVYGADIEPEMVMYLNDRARSEGIPNLTAILAAPDDPHLPQPVDLVFICNTYHHIDDRVHYLQRLRSQMRPGARIAIVDFRVESTRGPAHKLAPEKVEAEFRAAGYELSAEHDFLPDQYVLVFAEL